MYVATSSSLYYSLLKFSVWLLASLSSSPAQSPFLCRKLMFIATWEGLFQVKSRRWRHFSSASSMKNCIKSYLILASFNQDKIGRELERERKKSINSGLAKDDYFSKEHTQRAADIVRRATHDMCKKPVKWNKIHLCCRWKPTRRRRALHGTSLANIRRTTLDK